VDTGTGFGTLLTPWGAMQELRARQLRPGPGTTREAVERNQRDRLFGAVISSVATRGYGAVTVTDLTSLAGVSKASFYKHFENKADCFRAALEVLIDAVLDPIRQELAGSGNPKERGERALSTFIKLVAGSPPVARVALVEAYSAGSAGVGPLDAAFEEATGIAHAVLRMLPHGDRATEELARAVIGGIHRVTYLHLCRGEVDQLVSRREDLWRWACGYEPPDGLPRPRARRQAAPAPFAGRDQHERILRGLARAVAIRGVPKLTVPQIVAEAGISNGTFYRHFESKEDALLAALDLSAAQLIAAAMPAARREPAWPAALCCAVKGVCSFFAAEPAFARLQTVEVYSAGPQALAHRDRAWETIMEELVPCELREPSGTGRIALEACSGAFYALLYEKVRRGELNELRSLTPFLSYLVLAPFIGAAEASAVIAGSLR
jgi:AcrR family transcriptional regulator